MKSIWTLSAIAFALFAGAFSAAAQTQTVTATIDAGKTGPPISKYLYGQFIEHIGGIINNGLWAEMLDDRKFYFPVTNAAPVSNAGARGRGPLRRWNPIGPESAVTMDTNHPFVGDHTPLVNIAADAAPRGIRQGGLTVRKGKSYTGRVVLAGAPAAYVHVSLIWGTNAGDSDTVDLGRLRDEYREYPIKFTAGADSDNAQFVIRASGVGVGAFHIGAVSLMPADNLKGFRPEIIALIKQLHSAVYRFPGGNFVSGHEWRNAVGDPDRRPPTMDYAWNAVQPNDVGIDEFMTLCELLDVEPYITVNAGFGDAYSAALLVQYANGAADSTMGKVRAANGHREPYGIKFWGIGNEAYGDWQLGYTSLRWYELKHNEFAKAMRQVDPSIKLIASGAMPDEMTVTSQGKRFTGKVLTEVGSAGDWSFGMLSNCLPNMDLLSEHCYCNNNAHFDFEQGRYATTDDPPEEWMRRMANRVRAKYEAYQEYQERLPALKAKPVPINLDEWSFGRGMPQNSYRPVPGCAWALQEMFRHTEVFQMAAFTFVTACISANRTEAVFNPMGLMFKLYRDHYGTIPVEVTGNSPQPPPKYPVGGDQPKINAGSPTFPLDVSAAWSSDHKSLTIGVVNPTETEQHLQLNLKGAQLVGRGTLWRMAPTNINATVIVGQTPQVKIEEQSLETVPATLTVAPISVNIYESPIR